MRDIYGVGTQKLMKTYERTLHKKARWSNHHIFSMRCRDEGLVPQSLKVRPPIRTKEGFRIAERASRAFLSARIRQSYREKTRLEDQGRSLERRLETTMEEGEDQGTLYESIREDLQQDEE